MNIVSYVLVGLIALLLLSITLFAWKGSTPTIQMPKIHRDEPGPHAKNGKPITFGYVICPSCKQHIGLECISYADRREC